MNNKKVFGIIGLILFFVLIFTIIFLNNKSLNDDNKTNSKDKSQEYIRLESITSRILSFLEKESIEHKVTIVENGAFIGDTKIPGSRPESGVIVTNELGETALALYNLGFCATKGFKTEVKIVESDGECTHDGVSEYQNGYYPYAENYNN